MKTGEIIRTIVFIMIGWLLMFIIQPLLFTNRVIALEDVSDDIETWLNDFYTTGSWLVFGVSVVASLAWLFMTARASVRSATEASSWQVGWWLLGLLPVISVCIALYLPQITGTDGSDDALLSLAGLWIFDGLIWLYWWVTTTNTPGLFKHIPPGAFSIRRLLK